MKFTKVSCLALAALLSCLAARDASAQVVDIAKISCKQFLLGNIVRRDYLALWLSGYYNSSIRNTVIDLVEFARTATKVKDFCQTNPRATVMTAAERALGIRMPR